MQKEWQGSTDGNKWMQQQLINCFRFLNLRIYYAGVAFVVPFYMLFGRGFRSSYSFFRKRLYHGRIASIWWAYLNFFRFGQVIIDRFAAYAGKKFEIAIDNYEAFAHLSAQPQSFMILSAHVGNYELGGYHLISEQKTIYAMVFAGETDIVMENRSIQFGRTNIQMVPLSADMSHLFVINKALREGEIVSIPADRCDGSERTVACTFFGQPTYFPLGPFATIAQRRTPTLVIFVMKETTNRYKIFVRQIALPEVSLSKSQFIRNTAQQYATMVEEIVRRYPTQWFNFFNFWENLHTIKDADRNK